MRTDVVLGFNGDEKEFEIEMAALQKHNDELIDKIIKKLQDEQRSSIELDKDEIEK